MTGQGCRWNIDMLLCDLPHEKSTDPEFTAISLRRTHDSHNLARDHLSQAAGQWYKRRVNEKSFCVGDT